MEKIAVYPGTFDPITYGHIDIIKRAVEIFDRLIVGVATNPNKKPLFTVEERLEMIRQVIDGDERIEASPITGLVVDYAAGRGATAIIRGLRAVTDFEFEMQMALVNRKLKDQLITVFMMPHEKYSYLNSSIVKELAAFGADITCFVPQHVELKLKEKYSNEHHR